MTKPVLNLTGDPRDRGRTHGEILAKEIDQNLDRYLKRFQLLGFKKDVLMAESAKWAEALRPKDPIFWEEVDGVVEGSGKSLEEITLLNVRYELLVGMMKSKAQTQAHRRRRLHLLRGAARALEERRHRHRPELGLGAGHQHRGLAGDAR